MIVQFKLPYIHFICVTVSYPFTVSFLSRFKVLSISLSVAVWLTFNTNFLKFCKFDVDYYKSMIAHSKWSLENSGLWWNRLYITCWKNSCELLCVLYTHTEVSQFIRTVSGWSPAVYRSLAVYRLSAHSRGTPWRCVISLTMALLCQPSTRSLISQHYHAPSKNICLKTWNILCLSGGS